VGDVFVNVWALLVTVGASALAMAIFRFGRRAGASRLERLRSSGVAAGLVGVAALGVATAFVAPH